MTYLTIRQLADLLDCHENTIRNWCQRDLIPYETYGIRNYRRFDTTSIGRMLRHGELPLPYRTPDVPLTEDA